jgi:hypothetical protein
MKLLVIHSGLPLDAMHMVLARPDEQGMPSAE